METLNIKAEARSLIDKLPDNITWYDLIAAIYLRQTMKSEPIQVKGIKQGKTVKLFEEINIPDGSEITIEVRELPQISLEEKLKKIKDFLASLSEEDREEWRKIGEFLENDRTTNIKSSLLPKKQRRPPLFGSDREVISIGDNFDEPLEDFQDYM
jgi:predicted DNA-binding antitoxin AbrB/MazE fold protein